MERVRRLGASRSDDGTVELRVWAPSVASLDVHTANGAHALERGGGRRVSRAASPALPATSISSR